MQQYSLTIDPFFGSSSEDIANSDIINFAVGGATSGSENISPVPLGLSQQVDSLELLLSNPIPGEVVEDDLFFVLIGANDLFKFIEDDPNTPDIIETNFPKKTKKIVKEIVDTNIGGAIEDIIDLGGENIVVFSLPDLGETPLGLSLDPDDTEKLNDLTEDFNDRLLDSLEKFEESYSDINFVHVDLNDLFSDIFEEPEDYGLTNVNQGFTGTDLYTNNFDPTPTNPGDSADTYLFHDSVHPTTVGHRIIADFIIDELTIV